MVRAPPVDREDVGSVPPSPFRSLGNFVHPTLDVSFGRDTKSRWSKTPALAQDWAVWSITT